MLHTNSFENREPGFRKLPGIENVVGARLLILKILSSGNKRERMKKRFARGYNRAE